MSYEKVRFYFVVLIFNINFFLWIIPNYVFADLRQLYPSSPCNYHCGEYDLDSAWNILPTEPLQKFFCVDYNNCPNCCYQITYYEFVDVEPQEHLTDEYFINIVDIQWMGRDSCCKRDKDSIQRLFLDSLLNEKIQDSTFLHLNLSQDSYIQYFVLTPAICKEDTMVCAYTCCIQSYIFSLDPNSANYHKSILMSSRMYCDQCVPSCNITICENYPYHLGGDTICKNMPCPYGFWTSHSSGPISVEGCPNCQINIFYRYRKHLDCNPQYEDFILDSIQALNPSCDSCYTETGDIYQYALDWVIKYGASAGLSVGDCDSNIRILNTGCWGTWIDTMLGQRIRDYFSCDTNMCCWAVYKICRIDANTFTSQFEYGSLNDTIPACIPVTPAPCYFICNVHVSDTLRTEIKAPVTVKEEITVPKENSIVIPNPSEGEVIIKYSSIITGKIKLEIYDELGNLIYMKSLNKDDIELSIPVSLIDIGDGIFYYRIKNGNNIINNGIFSIIR